MTIALIIFGFFMASLVGWLVKQSVNTQPWVAEGPAPDLRGPETRERQAMRLGLVVLIAVITSMFGLFLSAYIMRMEYADWRPIPTPSRYASPTAVAYSYAISTCLQPSVYFPRNWDARRPCASTSTSG